MNMSSKKNVCPFYEGDFNKTDKNIIRSRRNGVEMQWLGICII